jgi:hypothetical protein
MIRAQIERLKKFKRNGTASGFQHIRAPQGR